MGQHTPSQPELSKSDLPLITLFQHNLWANLRLLDACTALDEEQLAAATVGTYGAIYDTIRHFVRSEQGYLNLLTLKKQGVPLGWDDNPGISVLRSYAQRSGEGLIAVAAEAAPSDVVEIKWHDGRRFPVPASLILTQAITHAAEHRAQVMTNLTRQGIEPPDLSAWSYVEEHVPPMTGE
jgi:uncharacterized damage-inducible protein DinB